MLLVNIISLLVLLSAFVLLSRTYTTAAYLPEPWLDCARVAQATDSAPQADSQMDTANAITLHLWAQAYGGDCWRAYVPVLAAQQLEEPDMRVEARAMETLSSAYGRAIAQAAEQGVAPDIAFAGTRELAVWGQAGYIIPFDECRHGHPEFDQVDERLWAAQRWGGHLWGAPLEFGVDLLYYNKHLLHELGWSAAEIAALPAAIRAGTFTLPDLSATAQAAVAQGIVQPGYAFWPTEEKFNFWQTIYLSFGGELYDPEQDQLIIQAQTLSATFAFLQQMLANDLTAPFFIGRAGDTWLNNTLRRDAIAQGRVLFWAGRSDDWVELRQNYVTDLGGEEYLRKTFGFAPMPSAFANTPGHTQWNFSGYYVIMAEAASGRSQQKVACMLLAATLSPGLLARHGIRSGQQSVIPSPAFQTAVQQSRFATEIAELLPSIKTAQQSYAAPFLWLDDGRYAAIVVAGLAKAEQGELPPADAAAWTIAELQSMLGAQLVVQE